MSLLAKFLDKKEPAASAYGDDSLATEEEVKSGILADIKGMGGDLPKDVLAILDAVKTGISGEPIDDRQLMMEKLMGVVAAMPRSSENRKVLTGKLIDQLWESLQHPPLSYVGEKFQFRQPDGTYNNIVSPDLGKAGAPYARTVRGERKPTGARPDPGLLFDLLMSRGNETKENPAGISSMLFYHASVIIHDIFRTNRKDANISDTSSYLDLSPLYGKNLEEQLGIRTMVDGMIKPDTFAEKRLLGLPPGNCVMLVMYSRFHNHVVSKLAAINEGGRFSLDRTLSPEDAAKKRDEHLFQTGRLVTCGLYISISLHDYIRAIGNLNHSKSDWTLDPRVEIGPSIFDKEGTPRGVGNQVSVEFNLLYRFHSGISKRDEKWTEDFFRRLFPVTEPKEVTLRQMAEGLGIFEKSTSDIPPHQRTFGGLSRKADGTFDDADLVKILTESIEDPAGAFGANNVPDVMRNIEILGIMQARKWQVATLNEFRKFFGLKTHTTFEEINPDPYVADTLRKLYDHPDLVEMYPGMFLEETKPRLDPGMGLCGPYTVTRAVFSDAVTLVRGDRFYTLDYTPQNLTNWGITEVAPDYQCMGGAKMSMLILNAFPKWFKWNSVYVQQPLFTPTESKKIFETNGNADQFDFSRPTLEKDPIPIISHAGLKAVLKDSTNFYVPWGPSMTYLMEGNQFMLAFDGPASVKQHQDIAGALYGLPDIQIKFKTYTEELFNKYLKRESYTLGKNHKYYQVDFVRDIGDLVALEFASKLFYIPFKTEDNPNGTFNERELLKIFQNANIYIFFDHDPTKTWARRRRGKEGIAALGKKLIPIIEELAAGGLLKNLKDNLTAGAKSPMTEYGKTFAKTLLGQGKKPKEVAWILICLAVAFIANTAQAFAQITDFYLNAENAAHLEEIKKLAAKGDVQSEDRLMRYALEANRLSNTNGLFREVQNSVSITDGPKTYNLNKGDRVFCSFVAASQDPTVFPEPRTVKLDRPLDSYIQWGEGPHQCLGRQINMAQQMVLVKTLGKLDGFRRTPGDEGQLKFIPKAGGIKLYMNRDWSDFGPYPAAMRVQFDAFGTALPKI